MRRRSVTGRNSRPTETGQLAALLWILVVLGFCALAFDLSLSRYLSGDPLPSQIGRFLRKAEPFGHAYGVGLIAITMALLDTRGLRRIPRLLVYSLGAGLLANAIKIFILRTRPYVYFENAMEGSSFGESSFALFQTGLSRALDTELHSCPSAHTATAIGLAIGLGVFYPQAGRWFLILAAFVALNRIQNGTHYVSDVLWGAAVGVMFTLICLNTRRLANWFDRLESNRPTVEARAPRRDAA